MESQTLSVPSFASLYHTSVKRLLTDSLTLKMKSTTQRESQIRKPIAPKVQVGGVLCIMARSLSLRVFRDTTLVPQRTKRSMGKRPHLSMISLPSRFPSPWHLGTLMCLLTPLTWLGWSLSSKQWSSTISTILATTASLWPKT